MANVGRIAMEDLHPPAHPLVSAHRHGFQAAWSNFDCLSVHFGLISTTFARGVGWGAGAGGETSWFRKQSSTSFLEPAIDLARRLSVKINGPRGEKQRIF